MGGVWRADRSRQECDVWIVAQLNAKVVSARREQVRARRPMAAKSGGQVNATGRFTRGAFLPAATARCAYQRLQKFPESGSCDHHSATHAAQTPKCPQHTMWTSRGTQTTLTSGRSAPDLQKTLRKHLFSDCQHRSKTSSPRTTPAATSPRNRPSPRSSPNTAKCTCAKHGR